MVIGLILLSLICLQTELDSTPSYYQLIIKITIFEKKRTVELWKRVQIYIKNLTNEE